MKKIIVGAIAAAALMTSAFARDFSVSGYVRGGYKANLSDTVDTNSDGKADKPGHTAERWLEGLYFGNKTRARLNFNWKLMRTRLVLSYAFSWTATRQNGVQTRVLSLQIPLSMPMPM